ncbi:hypothetical protein TIFTF001_052637 [Ficus carica]|uniref:Uncharacterized protein n=1 Tax=Ficus carica TaxID=3494 RepID=A0AA88EAP9_FICCA|nr:hypothetical protein TIFTF001_052637 [Ficus carica]
MVRVLAKASMWKEDECCGKEQCINEIVGGGVWLSRAGEVLQQLGFSNPVSPDNVVHFISNDSFCVNDFFLEVVSSPSKLVVYLSDLSFDDILIPLELLLCRVSGSPSAIEFWPSIDYKNPLIVGVFSKRALHVLDFSVPKYIPIIESQAYFFSFEHY